MYVRYLIALPVLSTSALGNPQPATLKEELAGLRHIMCTSVTSRRRPLSYHSLIDGVCMAHRRGFWTRWLYYCTVEERGDFSRAGQCHFQCVVVFWRAGSHCPFAVQCAVRPPPDPLQFERKGFQFFEFWCNENKASIKPTDPYYISSTSLLITVY